MGARFHDFTDQQWFWILGGYQKRLDMQWELQAWLAHHVYSSQVGGKAPTPDKLLGPEFARRQKARAKKD